MLSVAQRFSSGAAAWPSDAFAPSAPLGLGVLVNLNAKRLRANRDACIRELSASAGERAEVIATHDAAEAEHAIERFVSRGVNVLAVAGGDGTIHHTLQRLKPRGSSFWPGAVLPIPFGTLNILASSLSSPATTGKLRGLTQRRFGELEKRAQRLLRVRGARSGTRYGCLFGSEMVKSAVELYDRFGGGYGGLSKLLVETGRGYLFNTKLWQEESWRLVPPASPVIVDGELLRTYSAVAVASCDLAVAGGMIRALAPPGERGFSARVITEVRTGALLRMIPALMRQGLPRGVREFPVAERIELCGGYTLDGECFGQSTAEGNMAERVTIDVGGTIDLVA